MAKSNAIFTIKMRSILFIFFCVLYNICAAQFITEEEHTKFTKELSKYKQGKGSVQFPLTAPMPLTLIAKIVKYKAKMIMANNK